MISNFPCSMFVLTPTFQCKEVVVTSKEDSRFYADLYRTESGKYYYGSELHETKESLQAYAAELLEKQQADIEKRTANLQKKRANVAKWGGNEK